MPGLHLNLILSFSTSDGDVVFQNAPILSDFDHNPNVGLRSARLVQHHAAAADGGPEQQAAAALRPPGHRKLRKGDPRLDQQQHGIHFRSVVFELFVPASFYLLAFTNVFLTHKFVSSNEA